MRYLSGPIPDYVREEDQRISVRDGTEIVVRIYMPTKPPTRGSPLIVMYHEGAWSQGDLSDEEVNCRLFAKELEAVCVNVDYRLAPEHPFPTGILDCWDALQWAASNAPSLHANPALGFIVGGGSAGGNIAAVLAHMARDYSLSPRLTGQYLCEPPITCWLPPSAIPEKYRPEYLSHTSVTPCQDPVLQTSAEQITALLAEVLKPDFNDPRFVPFLYGTKSDQGHRNLPPAYFQVGGLDQLRDEALIYERVLREEAGVRTKLDLYPGLGHFFWTHFPRLEVSKRFVEDTIRGVRWLLERPE